MEIVKHCDDVLPAIKNIKGLIAVDGRIPTTSYVVALDHLQIAEKEIKKWVKEEE